jgi:hypothetical protein
MMVVGPGNVRLRGLAPGKSLEGNEWRQCSYVSFASDFYPHAAVGAEEARRITFLLRQILNRRIIFFLRRREYLLIQEAKRQIFRSLKFGIPRPP